jgi:DNA-binding response OmpR family regulator
MESRAEHPQATLSVIVIDDEPDVAAYLAAVLEKRGHVAYTAQTAAEGFSIIKQVRPDVACIDVVMPEETGVALLKRIRADDDVADTPVVYITALKPEMTTSSGSAIDEPTPQPDAYLEKPPNADAFVAAVERAARSRRAG